MTGQEGIVRTAWVVMGGHSCGELGGRCHPVSAHWSEKEAKEAAKGAAAWGSDGEVEARAVVFMVEGWHLIAQEPIKLVSSIRPEEGRKDT